MNKYTPKKDLNEITWLKGIYTSGTATDKKWAEQEAKKYYDRLRSYGYGNLADSYKNKNAAEAYSSYKSSYDRPYDYITSDADYDKVYKNYRNALNEATASAAADNIAYYDNMYADINKTYDDSARAISLNYKREADRLEDALAASGITGGMSESARLQALSGYQNSLHNNEAERNEKLMKLDFEKAQVGRDKNKGYADNAVTAAEYARKAYEADREYRAQQNMYDRDRYYDYYRDFTEDMHGTRDYNEDVRRWNSESRAYADEQEYESRKNKLNYAIELARLGSFGMLSGLLPGVSIRELKDRIALIK